MSADEPRDLPRIVFDREGTLKRLGGNQRLLAELIQIYLEDSPALLDRLEKAVNDDQAEAVRRAAHALRGLAANFVANDLINYLQKMEEQAATGSNGGFTTLLAQANHEAELLRKALEGHGSD